MAKIGNYSIGVDLGGTKILAAVVDTAGKVIGRAKKTTQADQGPTHVTSRIIKVVEEAIISADIRKQDIVSFGMGAPGTVDSKNGVVVELTNLVGWQNIPLARTLRRDWLDVPVSLSNDVRVAAIGEHRVGAGVGVDNLIAVFVGTGIGGGLVLNGKVFEGARGTAGEVGHMIMMMDGPYAFGTGVRGGIEALASRSAIERDLRHGLDRGRTSVLPELMAEKDGALTSSVLAKAVARNDALTVEVLRRAAYYLGLHAATLINAFDPNMLVYGGGVMEGLGKWMLPQIDSTARQYCINRTNLDQVHIVEAKLGEEAGAIGAALMSRDGLVARK